MSLREYARKRDFAHTWEPHPAVAGGKTGARARFVVQKHAASCLHYDLRLEMEGVLKSWAVPKGVPLRRGEKRLAVKVEDHPLAYADFEGTIPAGQYGAGTVMIWDLGVAEFKAEDPGEALRAGRLEFTLRGDRLTGDWALVRMRGEGDRWLLIRLGTDGAALDPRVASRNEQDFTRRFPMVAEAIAGLPVSDAVVDGEIVALDSDGRPSFQKLQAFAMGEERPAICFYAFDLPWLEGRDLRAMPPEERKRRLETVVAGGAPAVRFSPFLGTDARALVAAVKSLGFEGLVGKKKNSPYEAGQRSGAWIKLKFFHEQEFVIAGFTGPAGLQKPFGAVLVGYYDRGRLRFAGKVGSGWSAGMQRVLYTTFQTLITSSCPFVDLPGPGTRPWGQAIPAAEMRRCRWLEPRLACQVRFAEWTRDGRLRHPVWVGLRPDKRARQVRRESKAHVS